MPDMGVSEAILASGAISGGSSLLGGLFGSSAASSAAKTQARAAQYAAQLQAAMGLLAREDLAPYRTAGNIAVGTLTNELQPGGTLDPMRWQPTMEQLENTPGYKFTLNQGLKAAQNFMTSQGLGQSGAAGIANLKYAEGLAETTYQDQFTNFMNQIKQGYNQLAGLSQLGESAAAGSATAALNTGSSVGSDITTSAASKAAGTVGSANSLINALAGVGSAGQSTALLSLLNNAGMFGASNTNSLNSLSIDELAKAGGSYGGGTY